VKERVIISSAAGRLHGRHFGHDSWINRSISDRSVRSFILFDLIYLFLLHYFCLARVLLDGC
jgi:hypothetical protein